MKELMGHEGINEMNGDEGTGQEGNDEVEEQDKVNQRGNSLFALYYYYFTH